MRYPFLKRVNRLRAILGKQPLLRWTKGYDAINTYRIQLERQVQELLDEASPAARGLDL